MDQPQQKPKAPSHGPFQCTACQRTYTRVDHLARHVRSHLQERPFKCPVCHKAFGRPDLLKRHRTCHNGDQDGGKPGRRQYNSASRVSQACKSCASAKIKCDDEKPCSRCVQRGLTCDYAADMHDADKSMTSESPLNAHKLEDTPILPAAPDGPIVPVLALVGEPPDQAAQPSMSGTLIHAGHVGATAIDPQPVLGLHAHDMSGFLREVMTPIGSQSHFMHMDDTAGPRGLLDFTIDGDLELSDNDFGFLDQLCGDPFTGDVLHQRMQHESQQPAQYDSPSLASPLQPSGFQPHALSAVALQSSTRQHVALGAEAFRRSALGIWLPAQQDRGDIQLENLSILSAEVGSPDTRINLDRRCLRDSLNRTTRDEFLAMILKSCRPERVSIVVRSFPTSGLLDDLIECFFIHHQQRMDSFIHTPTFCPNGLRPELIGAIIASGATLTDVKTLRRLGFAMQEAVRTTVPVTCEEANATTRELWLLQAFLCEVEIGLWSGIKRKMEIAESHTPVVFTMLRRGGRFQHQRQAFVEPLPEDSGAVLQHKWLQWAKQECFKRLVFHAYLCDGQVSMAMLTNPIISYSELALSFPESRDLWMAEDAEQWKTLYINRVVPPNRTLSLRDFLQQPTELSDYYDVALSSLVILIGIWGMIWPHLQMTSVMGKAGGQSSSQQTAAFNALRHQDLLQTLQHFRINLSECHVPPCPEACLVLELLHVYLYVNFGDLQLFAGKGNIEDARRVLPALQDWVNSREARYAIWHAGQVLRAAAGFAPKQLQRFYAVAVYHAGLTLWTYGVIMHAKATEDERVDSAVSSHHQHHHHHHQHRNSMVVSPPESVNLPTPSSVASYMTCLDGVDSPAVQRFLTLGKGTPSVGFRRGGVDLLSGNGNNLVPLSQPEDVMDLVVETLERNFPANKSLEAEEVSSSSPLVENLVELLKDLGRAAAGHTSKFQ